MRGRVGIRGRTALAAVAALTVLAAVALLTLARPAQSAAGCANLTVKAGIVEAKGCWNQSGTTYTTDQQFQLNGIPLAPLSGVVTIDTATRHVSSGGNKVHLQFEGAPQDFAFDFNAPTGGEMTLEDINYVPQWALGFSPISGQVPLKLEPGGESEVSVTVKLPLILTLKGKEQTAQFDVAVKDGQPVFNGVDIELHGGELGGVFGIDEASFKYSVPKQEWDASATLVFPSFFKNPGGQGGDAPGFVVGFGMRGMRVDHIQLGIEGLNKPIGGGVYLQRLVGAIFFNPFGIKAETGVTAGPSVKIFGTEVSVVRVDGNIAVRANASPEDPGYFSFGGSFKVINIETAKAGLTVYFNGLVQFNVDFGLGLPEFNTNPNQPIFIGGFLHGWFDGPKYNLDGQVGLRIVGFDLAGARAVISDNGIAGCGQFLWWDVGGGHSWKTGQDEAFPANQCGVGRYRDPAHGAASAAIASAGRTALRLTPHESILKVVGDKGVPAFSLRSSDGRKIDYDPKREATLRSRNGYVGAFAPDNTAIVLLPRPAGKWELVDTPDEIHILGVRRAHTVPRPHVDGDVTGQGRVRTLHWKLTGPPGHKIRFMEVTAGGIQHPLFTTSSREGERRFKVDPGFHGKHSLRALVLRGGAPRMAVKLDRYVVRKPPRPGTPSGIKAQRLVHDVFVHWRGAKGARSYLVTLRNSAKGSTELVRNVKSGRRGVRFPGAPAGDAMVAKVYALGREDRRGKPAIDRFKAHGFAGTPRAAVERLLRSARRHPHKVTFHAPCPADGHCDLKVTLLSHGKVVGHAKVSQLVPDTVDLVGARLRSAAGGGLTVRASITQLGHTATRTGRIGAGRKD
jgi:hypothetical protein